MIHIKTVLSQGYQKLNKTKINSAHLDAELLLSFILRKSREYILAHPEIKLTKSQISKFNKLISERAKNIPLAYLTKEKEFYGRKFYVNEKVLIPRPETEQTVEEFRNQKSEIRNNSIIIDVGTGSGCIIITLVKEFENQKSKIKNLQFITIDISQNALTVARKNARLHGVDKKIKFLQGDLLTPVLKSLCVMRYALCEIIIVANLPYLTSKQIKNSPSIKHEPKLALAAGIDGLKYYRRFATQVQKLNIQYPNIPISIYCEINPGQSAKMKKIFSFAKSIEIKKDLAGRDRIFIVEL